MIRHIVMWNVRGDTPAEKAASVARIRECFHSLRGRIPGLLFLEVGADHSRTANSCDVVLYTEFESQAALDGYNTHPEHERVKKEVGTLRTHRYMVDYQAD